MRWNETAITPHPTSLALGHLPLKGKAFRRAVRADVGIGPYGEGRRCVFGRRGGYYPPVANPLPPSDEGKRSAVAVVNGCPGDSQSRDRAARRRLSAKLTEGEIFHCQINVFAYAGKITVNIQIADSDYG